MKLHNHKYLLAILLLVVLASCKVGKKYARPDVPVPQQYRYASEATAADSSIAVVNWNQLFTDPVLQQLIEKALQENLDLQIAMRRLDMTSEYVKQAKLQLLPAINAQVSGSYSNPSENSLNGISLSQFLKTDHIEDYTASLGLSWEIDVWGRIRRQKEAAVADYLQTFEAARAVKTALVANVANAYFNLLMFDEQIAIAQRNLELSDTIVRIMRLQKESGEATELAVQQAIVQQQTAAILLPQLRQAAAIQEHALSLLLGEAPTDITRNASLRSITLPEQIAAGVPAALLSNRPDVKASEMSLVAANARAGAAQAAMYPTLSITASGGLNAFKASNWFSMPASLFGMAAGGLTQPLFQHRRLRTQWNVAKLQRDQAAIEFRLSVLNAVREVSDALVSAEQLKEQYSIAAAQTDTLQKSIRYAQLLFRSGMANYLEVITVQGKMLQSELAQAQLKRQQLNAQVELYRSLGGGWR